MSANGQHPLLQRLADGKPLISDGAGGTYLQSKGLEPGGSPEEMNASAPETIREMATAYFDAGSDMVLTASFGGSRFMLEKYGLGGRVAELNRLAAHHARSVTPEGGFVVGSVGPTGEILESNGGEVGEEEVLDAFVEQVIALEAGGADAVAVETMISAQEAVLAIQAATENTDLVVFGTMMFDKGPRGWFSMMGDTPESAVKADAGRRRGRRRRQLRQRRREDDRAGGRDTGRRGRVRADPFQRRNSRDQKRPDSLPRDPRSTWPGTSRPWPTGA